jgi:acetolactate synthase-1/3 small subunit
MRRTFLFARRSAQQQKGFFQQPAGKKEPMRRTISVLVDNKPGVLARVAGLFSGRGFNIESLSVNETLDPTMSQMTIVTRGDEPVLEQINKQLNKLIDVIKVIDYEKGDKNHLDRELALIKVAVTDKCRAEILSIIEIFRCKIIDVGKTHYTIEITGDEDKLRAIIELLRPLGIREIVRSGKVTLQREARLK